MNNTDRKVAEAQTARFQAEARSACAVYRQTLTLLSNAISMGASSFIVEYLVQVRDARLGEARRCLIRVNYHLE